MTPRREGCEFCGQSHPIGGLTTLPFYVGGSGYEMTTLCVDRSSCRRRQDRAALLVEMRERLGAGSERRVLI